MKAGYETNRKIDILSINILLDVDGIAIYWEGVGWEREIWIKEINYSVFSYKYLYSLESRAARQIVGYYLNSKNVRARGFKKVNKNDFLKKCFIIIIIKEVFKAVCQDRSLNVGEQ